MKRIAMTLAFGIGLIGLFSTVGQTANRADHGLFCTCSTPADTAVYAGVARRPKQGLKHYTLNITATATGSAGSVSINFRDGDSIAFPVPADTTTNITQTLGGVPGVDDIVKITVAGGVASMMVSVLAEVGAIDPFDETLDAAPADISNFVVTEPSEAGSTSAAAIF